MHGHAVEVAVLQKQQARRRLTPRCASPHPLTSPQCTAANVVQSGPLKGGCAAMAIQYDLLNGLQADTQLGTAGGRRPGRHCLLARWPVWVQAPV